MANTKFSIVTKDFSDYDTDKIGVNKDAFVQDTAPNLNYGGSDVIIVRDDGAILNLGIISIVMPNQRDIVGADDIVEVLLILTTKTKGGAGAGGVKIFSLPDIDETWFENILNGVGGFNNFRYRTSGVEWSNYADHTQLLGDEAPIDSLDTPSLLTEYTLHLTSVLGWGAAKSFILANVSTGVANVLVQFYSRDFSTAPPILRVLYKSYPPEGFDSDENRLRIVPNPDNPEQPKLEWGAVSAEDFTQYKIYRSLNPFSSVEGFTSAITGVDVTNKKFIISADHTPAFPVGSTFKISGSVLHNGRYTVVGAVFSGGNTTIEVAESIATGAISSFSNPGGGQVDANCSAVHGLPGATNVEIFNTANYDGIYLVAVVDADTFRFTDTWVATETGNYTTIDGVIHRGIETLLDGATEEYIDTDSIPNGTLYYYKVVAEDEDNHEDDGLLSSTVTYTKPDITTATLSPSGAQNVGTEVTIAVVAPQNIKRLFVDWKDGIESWYDFDIVGLSKSVKHVYANDSGAALTPDVRVEDVLGFWSSLEAATNTITVNDTSPLAKLLVNIKRDHVGVEVTLNAALSQPAGSNVTITKYEFKRYTGDSWHDNGTDPIYSFSTTGFSVGTKTAELRITTSTTLQDTDTVDYDLESGDPVELVFSRNTRIHEIAHDLTFDKDFRAPLEGEGVEFEFKTARRAERITVNGTSHTPDMDTDMGIIRSVWLSNTYIRIRVKNEVEGKDVLYDGKVESDVTVGHSYPNLQTWSFNMVVFDRTEV